MQPDVLIVSDRNKLDERGMHDAPDWVAEVLSPTTASHDAIVKRAVYERAGIPEVWLMQPADQTLTVYRLEGERYGHPIIVEWKGRTPLGIVPEVAIDWDPMLRALE